jgi:hypothetical protein
VSSNGAHRWCSRARLSAGPWRLQVHSGVAQGACGPPRRAERPSRAETADVDVRSPPRPYTDARTHALARAHLRTHSHAHALCVCLSSETAAAARPHSAKQTAHDVVRSEYTANPKQRQRAAARPSTAPARCISESFGVLHARVHAYTRTHYAPVGAMHRGSGHCRRHWRAA